MDDAVHRRRFDDGCAIRDGARDDCSRRDDDDDDRGDAAHGLLASSIDPLL